MIKSIEFRYNRYESTLSLILLVGLFWLVGFALCLGLANVLGLQNGTEAITPSELSLFWQRHAGLALAFTVLLYTSAMIFSVYPAIGLWRFLMDAKGKVEIYDDHAIIYFKSKEVFIDPSTDISHEFIFGTGSGSRSVAIKHVSPLERTPLLPTARHLCLQARSYLQERTLIFRTKFDQCIT